MKRKKKGYWTKDKCLKEALRYKSRSEFKCKSGGAYNAALKNHWLEEICAKMIYAGNRFKRLVYIYEFDDKSVYVGLTYNIEQRDKKHRRHKKSGVYKHIKKNNLEPKLIYTEYMHVEKAKILEGKTVEKYRNLGYKILNISKTGGVGGGFLKWTFEKCLGEAKKCKTRKEFVKINNSAYNSARANGWLEKICSHMQKNEKKPIGYWDYKNCKEEALKFRTRNQFYKKSSGAYMSCIKNKWLNDMCLHMIGKIKKPNGYWTKEKCQKEALKYKTRTNFQNAIGSAYRVSLDKGWLNEICIHMNKK